VSLDTSYIAREAVQRITARIEHPEAPAEEVIAPHRLVTRESTLGFTPAPAA
jgi:DNA-binding LacI/PurR family transcriptional regulator